MIVTDIVRRVIVFSCILVPTCRYSYFHNLAQWTGDQTWSGVYNLQCFCHILYLKSICDRICEKVH